MLLIGFAAVPGFPTGLFLLLSATLAFCGYRLSKHEPEAASHASEPVTAMQRAGAKVDVPAILTRPPQFACPLGVRMAPDLVPRLSSSSLQKSFESERSQLQEYLGLPFPGITMWTSDTVPESTCQLLMHDVPYCSFELPPGKVMLAESVTRDALLTSNREMLELMERCEQRPGLDGSAGPTYWIDEKALPPKVTAWRTEQVIAHASVAMLRRHASLFLGIQEVQWILEQQNAEYPGLVAEVQKVLPPQRIADVLRRLLEEQISIRSMRSILESLIVWGAKEKDMLMLTEYVRGDLARMLAHRAANGARQLAAVLLDLPVEQHIRQAIKQTPTGNFLALPPDEVNYLIDKIQSYVGDVPREGVALVTSMDIRRYVRRMIESRLGWLSVYSFQELGEHVELQPLGRVTV